MSWFPQFPRIRSKPSQTPSLPYNSYPQEAEGLRVLREHPRWKDLQRLLERVAQSEYDRLASGLPYEDYLAQVGAYQAAARAVDMVDTILSKVKDNDERERNTSDAKRDHRNAISYASPYGR